MAMIQLYVYPVIANFILGYQSKIEVPIIPDVAIRVQRYRSNTPEPGMFIVHETDFLYQHDPFLPNVSLPIEAYGIPVKRKGAHISKTRGDVFIVEHTGFIPKGYLGGMSFMFTYHFIGKAYEN